MSKFNNIMLDIETMGTQPSGALTAIALVFFDIETGEIGKHTSVTVNLQQELDMGATVNASTIFFWMEQEEQAQNMFKDNNKEVDNYFVCEHIADFVERHVTNYGLRLEDINLWGHPVSFDNVMFRQFFERYTGDVDSLPSWRNDKDCRTVFNLAKDIHGFDKNSIPFDGVKHKPLDDCIHQVKCLVEALNVIKNKPDSPDIGDAKETKKTEVEQTINSLKWLMENKHHLPHDLEFNIKFSFDSNERDELASWLEMNFVGFSWYFENLSPDSFVASYELRIHREA